MRINPKADKTKASEFILDQMISEHHGSDDDDFNHQELNPRTSK